MGNLEAEKIEKAIRYAAKTLGTGNASSEMGALEYHAVCIKEAGENIASAIRELAEAVRNRT